MLTTERKRRSRGRPSLFTWLTILMFMVSLTPAATSVVAGQPMAPQNQQQELAQGTGSFIEVHVSACEPGATGTPQQLKDLCHDNGVADVQMNISSVDPALGIDLDKTTVRINGAGPGITNTGTIPAGEYLIDVNIPGDLSSFVVGCEFFDRAETLPATPDDSQQFRVTVPQGEDVVCDLYVIPQGGNGEGATLDFTVRYCERTDLNGSDRSFEELSENCTTIPAPPTAPPTPISISVGMPGGEASTQPLDEQGTVTFAGLANGDYPVFSNIDLDASGEYLFCSYAGQERYEKDFNSSGTTTFTNLLGEEISCDWFVVYVPQDAPPPPPTKDDGRINLDVVSCPQDYDVAANGDDGVTFAANCTSPVADVLFTLANSADVRTEQTSSADGTVAFTGLAPDTAYKLWSGIPLEAATEYVFCTPPGGVEAPVQLSERGVATFSDFEAGTIDCAWYIVAESQRGDETGATVTVHLAACPQEYAGDQFYADCHANGVADLDYTLSGPDGEVTATTSIPVDPGPGVATFTRLPAGDYTLAGGPPQDFGTVALYCSDPATSERVDATMEGGIAHFSIAEQQSVLCDWYFIPDDARGDVTPTPVPAKKAEILVTLFTCPPGMETAGATFAQLDDACGTTLNDVNFSLGVPGGTPLSAATGVSGDGAVRFFELRPGDYVMTPNVPADFTSAAVYCQIGDGPVYQKTLQSGSTTFVNVEGEQIACSWFLTPKPQPQPQPVGPTGSITVREFLCEGDRGSIKDWERECVPGATDSAFTLKSSDGAVTRNAKPDAKGVLVFSELPDGYYDLSQDTGVWCKAAAERVDSRSRVIVRDGGNTDVFIYECGQVKNLPSTGTGPLSADPSTMQDASILLAGLAVPAFGAALWQMRRTRPEPVRVRAQETTSPIARRNGSSWMRFR